jgi:hypothetical protein
VRIAGISSLGNKKEPTGALTAGSLPVDKLVTNLKAWRDGKDELAKLEREVEQRLNAAKIVIPQLK